MGEVTVFGGEGSLAADTDALRAIAAVWGRGAELLRGVYLLPGAEALFPALPAGGPSRSLMDPERLRAEGHLSAAREDLYRACTTAASEYGSLATALEAAAANYEETERAAMQLDVAPSRRGPATMFALLGGMLGQDPPPQASSAEGIDSVMTALGLMTWGISSAAGLSGVMAGTAWWAERLMGGPAGAIVVQDPEQIPDAPDSRGSLASLVDLQALAWEGKGSLIVTRYGSAEDPTWVVSIPGTKDVEDGAWGSARIPEAMSGSSPHVEAAVLAALNSVHARPGERVVLNGHSQGGRHALNLAAAPELNRRYSVIGAVTAGAPSGTESTPPSVEVIQLEDPDDVVPGLDGSTVVPTDAHRLLVRGAPGSPSTHAVAGTKPGVLGWEHKVANYRDLAAAADADTGAALPAAVSALRLEGGPRRSYRVPTTSVAPASGPAPEVPVSPDRARTRG